jgi:hypothetical protein
MVRGVFVATLALPLRPLWPGFAINTVFYAAILWMLFAVTGAMRGWRRAKRGLCVKCGYDLRGRGANSTACPECGAAVRAEAQGRDALTRCAAPHSGHT